MVKGIYRSLTSKYFKKWSHRWGMKLRLHGVKIALIHQTSRSVLLVSEYSLKLPMEFSVHTYDNEVYC